MERGIQRRQWSAKTLCAERKEERVVSADLTLILGGYI